MVRERLTVTVEEAGQMLGVSRAYAYQLAREGHLPVVRLGRRLVVPMRQLHAMLEQGADRRDSHTKSPAT